MVPDLQNVHRLVSPCAMPSRQRVGQIFLNDAQLSVWEEHVDEREYRAQVFLPLIAHLQGKGWEISPDPLVAEKYVRLSPYYRICRRGPLEIALELAGRTITADIYIPGADRGRGGRGGVDKLLRMTPSQRLLSMGILLSAARHLVDRHGYRVASYEPDLRGLNVETPVPIEWDNDLHRTSGDGVLIEHGQPVYAFDDKGRVVHGKAYHCFDSNWWLALNKTRATLVDTNQLFVAVPENPRIRRHDRARHARIAQEI